MCLLWSTNMKKNAEGLIQEGLREAEQGKMVYFYLHFDFKI